MTPEEILAECPEYKSYIEEIIYGNGKLENQNVGKILIQLSQARKEARELRERMDDLEYILKLAIPRLSGTTLTEARNILYKK